MNKLTIIFFLLTVFSQLTAQDYDFGDVSREELQEQYHPLDSSANAAILYRNEKISFNYSENIGFVQQRYVQMRIKIYRKDGLDWANQKVYLYRGNSNLSETIKGLKGYTYNFIGGKIEKDRLKNDGIFDEEASEIHNITSFILPNVKEGSVLEYEYTVTTESPFINDLNLQYNIPINKLDVRIATPQFYSYKKVLNPKASFIPNLKETISNQRITRSTRRRSSITSTHGGSFDSSSYDMTNSDYIENVVSLSEENIPALKVESYSGSLNNYKAKLSMELAAVLDANNIVRRSFLRTWKKVSKLIYESDNFGGQLTSFSIYENDLEALMQGVDNDFQKAFIVENLVKSKVKWNGVNGKYTQKGVRSAYKEGVGNVADINLMVVSMLRSQGVNANPVLISTRDNGVPLFPTRDGFNYVICMVESEGQNMLIDATEPYSTNNVLPKRVLNWQGRVFAKDGSSYWIDMKTKEKSAESTMLNVKINDDLYASGQVRKNYTSYAALEYRQRHTNLSLEDHIKLLEENNGTLEISELNFENDKNIVQPVKIDYKYELSDGIDKIGENVYFSPMLFLRAKENPFKMKERAYPIDFVVPFEFKYLVNIMIPESFKAEALPKSEAFEFNGGEAKFVYILKENGKYLQLRAELEINNPLIQPSDYKDFKSFFAKIVEKQAEQIVLTKA